MQTVCHDITYIIFISYKIWWAHNWWSKRWFWHIDTMPHLSVYVVMVCNNCLCNAGDDVIIDWQSKMWLGNGKASMWKIIVISLNINFIHGDIHVQWCKKYKYALQSYWFWMYYFLMYIWIFNSWLVVQRLLFKFCIHCTLMLCNLSEAIKWYFFPHLCF